MSQPPVPKESELETALLGDEPTRIETDAALEALDEADIAANLEGADSPSEGSGSDPPLGLADGTLEARPSAAVSAEAAALRRARANLVRGIAEDAKPAPRPAPLADPHSNVLVQAIQAMRIISIGEPEAATHRPSTAPAYAAPREEPALAFVEPLDMLDAGELDSGEPIEPTPIMPLVAEVVVRSPSGRPVSGLVEMARARLSTPAIPPPALVPDAAEAGSLDVDLDAEEEAIEPEDRISEIPPEVDPDDLEISEPEPARLISPYPAALVSASAAAPNKVISAPPAPSARMPSQPAILPAAAMQVPSVRPIEQPSTQITHAVPASGPVSSPIAPAAAPASAPQPGDGSLIADPATRPRAKAWWDVVFSDDFQGSDSQLTKQQLANEVSFIEESLGVEQGGVVLDLACGAGRHAVELALRGYSVVGYDLSVAMLARASDEAQERNARINFLQGDMREMGFEDMFDGVYSWCTSFGFFDEEKNAQVVQRIHRALRKGGMFLLDVLNRDFVTQRQPSLVWFEGDSCICMDETRVDYITSRLRVKRTVMLEDGRTREIEYSMRLYSLHELGRVLHDAGFKVTEVSGHPAMPGVFFGADSPRLIVLAEKA